MKIDLKECPFCASKKLRINKVVLEIRNEKIFNEDCHVECFSCGCRGPTRSYVENVIDAWNKR